MYGAISVSSFVDNDERLLNTKEHTFVFLRGRTELMSFLCSFSEVFGRSQIRLKLLKLLPTDLVGSTCFHCNELITDLNDLALSINKMSVTTILHESCFRHWFMKQEKSQITPYRFALASTRSIACEAPFTTFITGSTEILSPVSVTVLENLNFNSISSPTVRATSAEVNVSLSNSDKPGMNLFFCPRCNATQEISFLDTEEKIHTCSSCCGRFQIIVKEVL